MISDYELSLLSLPERQEVLMAVGCFQRSVYNRIMERKNKERRRQMGRMF